LPDGAAVSWANNPSQDNVAVAQFDSPSPQLSAIGQTNEYGLSLYSNEA